MRYHSPAIAVSDRMRAERIICQVAFVAEYSDLLENRLGVQRAYRTSCASQEEVSKPTSDLRQVLNVYCVPVGVEYPAGGGV